MPDQFQYRSQETELMDDLNSSGQVIDRTLRELNTINRWLGGDHVTINGLSKLLAGSDPDKTIEIMDLGCGGGDILKKICNWARKHSVKMHLTGIDANPHIVEYARRNTADFPEISYRSMNIFSDEFREISCDIVTSTLFTHHFTSDQLSRLFLQLRNQASLGMIINDLHRHWFAYHSIKWLTNLFSRSEMVRNDAAVSVLRAFRKEELEEILTSSALNDYEIEWFWAFRWQVVARW